MTHTEFTEKEALVLDLLGLPTTIDEILDLDEDEQNSLCDTIHHEMLGPGVSNNELNEYGSV